jgi:enoyl-CoA hydratase/carnithine racemase
MSFASRERAILSQWEVGVGMLAGGGPMALLPELIGRNRALEVLLSSEDIRGDRAEAYGYVNRALPDAKLDAFVEAPTWAKSGARPASGHTLRFR